MNPLKVLHIGADNIGYGGRSVIAFDLTQHMDKNIVVNNFLVFHTVKEKKYIDALQKKGGKYVEINIDEKIPKLLREIRRTWDLARIIREDRYDIIHIHADNAYEAMRSVWAGKLAGARTFAIHAHTTGSEQGYGFLKRKVIRYCQRKFSKGNYMQFACSKEAACYLFGNESNNRILILKNGINTEKFCFDKEIRQKVKERFGYKREQLIVGSIGRFSFQKNYFFTIDIFEKLLEKMPDARLMLIGEGSLKGQIKKIVKDKGISNSVDFLGNRNDVSELLQAMDVFLLPSLYEGFGIVNLEAQCAGLPCVVSTEVPEMVHVTELIRFMSLEESAEIWADTVMDAALQAERKSHREELVRAGFDIAASADKLQKYYEKIG